MGALLSAAPAVQIKPPFSGHRLYPRLHSFPFSFVQADDMPFTRSVTSLLRTSRTGLSISPGANPVNRVFGHDRFGARTYAAVFERNKPHVNVGGQCKSDQDSTVLMSPRYNWPCGPRQSTAKPTFLQAPLTLLTDDPHRGHHEATSRKRLCTLSRVWRH